MSKSIIIFFSLWLLFLTDVFSQENPDNKETGEVPKENEEFIQNNDKLSECLPEDEKNNISINYERIYCININLKILDDQKKLLVNSKWNMVTMSGRPVALKVKGNNLYITADLTPYYVDKKSLILLTRGNVKLDPVNSEVSKYYSTVNSLPIKLGEKALFFPLGLLNEKMENISSCVLEIEVQPYDKIEDIKVNGSSEVGEQSQKEQNNSIQ